MTPPDSDIRAYFEAQGWTIEYVAMGYTIHLCKRGKKIPFTSLASAYRRIGP